MSAVTTHVLDTVTGTPAAGVAVLLEERVESVPEQPAAGAWRPLAHGVTDADGRIPDLGPDRLPAGTYRLVFGTGAWFAARATATFYPEVVVVFAVIDPDRHHHVPLLLSPFAYSTYRGS